jgi:hypothetical protein
MAMSPLSFSRTPPDPTLLSSLLDTLERRPRDTAPYARLVELYAEAGWIEEAREAAERWVSLAPADPVAQAVRASLREPAPRPVALPATPIDVGALDEAFEGVLAQAAALLERAQVLQGLERHGGVATAIATHLPESEADHA